MTNRNITMKRIIAAAFLGVATLFSAAAESEVDGASLAFEKWIARAGLKSAQRVATESQSVALESTQQDWGTVTPDRSCHTRTPIRIGTKSYEKGLGTHSNGRTVFSLKGGFKQFLAEVGIDNNPDTRTNGSVVFVVKVDGREIKRTPVCRGQEAALSLDIPVAGAQRLELVVMDAGDGINRDQADWADARVVDVTGKTTYLSDVVTASLPLKLSSQDRLPGSFVYHGESSTKLLAKWPHDEKPVVDQADRRIYEVSWKEPDGGLVATWRAEVFKDVSAMEFRWTFSNSSATATAPLSEVRALDLVGKASPGKVRLVHSTGGLDGGLTDASLGFVMSETKLGTNTLAAAGGRSSNKDLPFFLLCDDTRANGIFVGVGWSGQWQADFDFAPKDVLRVKATMPGMNLRLPPGEFILTPSILLGTFHGNAADGGNALRRVLHDKYLPKLSGKKPLPPVSWNSWFVFDNRIDETLLKQKADAAAELGIEYFCIDAGWFDGGFPYGVGNWTIDRAKFPAGLRPIGDYVAAKGMKLGLWFEPERADANTRLLREHPEWVHDGLVDFGNAECRAWIFAMMTTYIDEGRVNWIRYDFNMEPLPAWDNMDTAETRGLAQIRHVQGLYELLDKLRAKYPDLLIEGCASGGRRIDLETVKRSHTHWKSDNTAHLPVMRFHETGGNSLLPGGLLNANLLAMQSVFDLHSLFGGPLGFGADLAKLTPEAKALLRQQIANYKTVRHLLNQNYYRLFPQLRNESNWVGWQFHDPKANEGFAVLLRPTESSYRVADVRFGGITRERNYRITKLGEAQGEVTSGSQLADNWSAELSKPNSSMVMHYRLAD
jgi:alpha-galactosidase